MFTPVLSTLRALVDAADAGRVLMDGRCVVPEWMRRLVDGPSDCTVLRIVHTADYSVKTGTRSGIPAYEVSDTSGLDVKWIRNGMPEPLSGFVSISVPGEACEE